MFAYMPNRNITTCFIFIFRCSQSHFFFVSFITILKSKPLCVCLCVRVRACVWMGGCTEIICLNSYCMCVEPEHLFVEVLNKNFRLRQSTCFLTFIQFPPAPAVLETLIEQCWKKLTHFQNNILFFSTLADPRTVFECEGINTLYAD